VAKKASLNMQILSSSLIFPRQVPVKHFEYVLLDSLGIYLSALLGNAYVTALIPMTTETSVSPAHMYEASSRMLNMFDVCV